MGKTFILLIVFFIFLYTLSLKRSKCDKEMIINTLIRGCSRWGAASLQDKSPIVRVLHANYAAGYLWALSDIFSDRDIESIMNIDFIKFTKRITDIQDSATKSLLSICPKYASEIDPYLGSFAQEYYNKV
jgi:hypothetical protein